MSSRSLLTLAAPLVLAALSAAQTQEAPAQPALLPGDAAPRIEVAEWVQGTPVTSFEKGTPYVVEFWATWCGPCKRSIPHLNELYREHAAAGLRVIGVSVWERDTSLVAPFVQDMGDKMTYTVARDQVAADDERGMNGFMAVNWMRAADQHGIPAAFVIDREGRIAWIGHPMQMDEPLDAVLASTWDVAKARKDFLHEREVQARMSAFSARSRKLVADGDYKGALALLDELVGTDAELARTTASMRFDWMLKSKDLDAAYAWARKAIGAELADQSAVLNSIAWMIVDPRREDLERRDLDVALAAAQRADELTKNAEPNILDTLARVRFLRGELEQAIALQTRAVELAPEAQKASLQKTLEEYTKRVGG